MPRPLEAIIASVLKSVAALGNRVSPMIAKGDKAIAPYAVYTVISNIEQENHDGDAGMADALVQIDVYSKDVVECKQIAEACRDALRASPEISCATEDSGNGYEDDTELYWNSSDYAILVYSED